MPQGTGTNLDFFGALTTGPGGDVNFTVSQDGTMHAAQGDGTIQYYQSESAKIQKALRDPNVSPERKQELQRLQAELDQIYYPQRVQQAQTNLQNAGSDQEATAALQALESLKSTAIGGGGSAAGGGATAAPAGFGYPTPSGGGGTARVSGSDAMNATVSYDPTDEATIRASWEDGPKQQGVSYEDYKRQVAEANPTGDVRYTSTVERNPDGSFKTFPGYDSLFAGGGAGTGEGAYGQGGVSDAQIQRAANLGYFDNVSQRAIAGNEAANAATDKTVQDALASLGQSKANTRAKTEGYTNQLINEAQRQNARSDASLARYTGAVDTANAGNLSALDAYKTGIAPYQTEIPGTTRQDVQFDPEGLAAQRNALGMGSSIYGGSLDYTSQAAQAYANPADVARALEGIGMLRENATTGGNEQRTNLDIAREEFANGGANQQQALDYWRGITGTEMTAAERAVLDQSNRQAALLEKANRDATMRALADRGILSGTGVIAGQQAAAEQAGQERTAGILGAQAQAVQRSVIGKQGFAQAANDLRTSQQNAEALMQQAANALRAGDLAAAQAYTAAAQRQREQGFAEEYARGTAADTASANNQATRLGGANIYANEANAIRTANDNINMFNNNQQGITDRFNAGFKQDEYERLTGLQQDTLNNTVGVNQTNLGNEGSLNTATQSAIGQQFGRTNTGLQTGIGTAFGNYGNDAGYTGQVTGAAESSNQRTTATNNQKIGTAKTRIGLGQTEDDRVQAALERAYGYKIDKDALTRPYGG